jgi:hypothetical protein
MNMGRVSIGYQLSSVMVEAKGISIAPSPHSASENAAATNPIAPNTRCPVSSRSMNVENIRTAIAS